MEYYYLVVFFILGSVLASFYGVIGERLPKGESILRPKYSYCPNCKKRLKWYELIPIFSYIIQGGKCNNCKKSIPIIYLFIEIVSGLLFAVSYYSFGFSYELIVALTLVSFFIIVIVSDLTYMIIPDEVTLTCGIIIIIVNFLNYGFMEGLIKTGWGIVTFLVMYGVLLLGYLLFKKEALGGADVKLMFLAGLTLHPILGVLVIFLASCIALPISLVIYMTDREHEIPFGPFLAAAMLLLYFLKIDMDIFLSIFI